MCQSRMQILRVQTEAHACALQQLSLEYFGWLDQQYQVHYGQTLSKLVGMDLSDYVSLTQSVNLRQSANHGAFYLLELNQCYIGMAGLRRLTAATAEIKRLYVNQALRGQGYATLLLDFLVEQAHHLNYQKIVLDSAPFMTSAHRLYTRKGFVKCAAYSGTEVPLELQLDWHFMELQLAGQVVST